MLEPQLNFLNPARHLEWQSGLEGFSFAASYRDQWKGISNASAFQNLYFQTDYTGWVSPLDGFKAGILFNREADATSLRSVTGSGIYGAYYRKLSAGNYKIIIGTGVSMIHQQFRYDTGNFWFSNQFDFINLSVDSTLPSGENILPERAGYIRLNAGLSAVIHFKNKQSISIEYARHNVNQPKSGNNNAPSLKQAHFSAASHTMLLSKKVNQITGLQVYIADKNHILMPSYNILFNVDSEESAVEFGLTPVIVDDVSGISLSSVALVFGLHLGKPALRFVYHADTSTIENYTRSSGTFGLSLTYTLARG